MLLNFIEEPTALTLIKQTSFQVAESKDEIRQFQYRRERMTQVNAQVQGQRDSTPRQDLQDISIVFRLQQDSAFSDDQSYDEEGKEDDRRDGSFSQTAMDMTLSN
jgi:hypothetical protein